MALFNSGRDSKSASAPDQTAAVAPGAFTPMEDLLRLMIEENASDLHISVGAPPSLRINGRLVKMQTRAVLQPDMEVLTNSIAGEEQMRALRQDGSVDFAYSYRSNRFRISLYLQRGFYALALRLIPQRMLSLDEIGLPEIVRQLISLPRGLILITGPTGSGKTTSLASMLDFINSTRPGHIITIEDPIEYVHEHRVGMMNQRQVGADVPSFAEGLRRALRQDPDVILVGEMRDLETMETAITAAETGHLVFSTLHTTGAGRTVDRIVDAFPAHQQEQIRVQLSSNLKAVISQLLIPRIDRPGRIAVFELMVNTHSIGALIRENKTYRIASEIQTGAKFGMVSLEAALVDLYLQKIISLEEVMGKSQDPEMARQLLDARSPRK